MKASTQGLLIAGGVAVVGITLWLVLKPKNVVTEYTPTPQPPSNPTIPKFYNESDELTQSNQVLHNGKIYNMVLGTGIYKANRYWRDDNGDTWYKIGAGIGATPSENTGKIGKTGMDLDDYTK